MKLHTTWIPDGFEFGDHLAVTVPCDLVGTDDLHLWTESKIDGAAWGWMWKVSGLPNAGLFKNYSSKTQLLVKGWDVSATRVGKGKDHGFS